MLGDLRCDGGEPFVRAPYIECPGGEPGCFCFGSAQVTIAQPPRDGVG
jgi:hypothetical protein